MAIALHSVLYVEMVFVVPYMYVFGFLGRFVSLLLRYDVDEALTSMGRAAQTLLAVRVIA